MPTHEQTLAHAAAVLDSENLQRLAQFTQSESATVQEPEVLIDLMIMGGGENRPRRMINVRVVNYYYNVRDAVLSLPGILTGDWASLLEAADSVQAIAGALKPAAITFDERSAVLYAAMIGASEERAMKIGKTDEAITLANSKLSDKGLPSLTRTEVDAIVAKFKAVGLVNEWAEDYMVCDRLFIGRDRV